MAARYVLSLDGIRIAFISLWFKGKNGGFFKREDLNYD